jgi:hypothetical protein
LFPVRLLFLKRSRAIADFHPTSSLFVIVIWAEPGILHVSEVFAFGDRSLTQRLLLNRFEQISLSAGLHAGSNQVTHFK